MQGRNSEGSGKERGRDARHGRRRPRLLVRRRRDGHGRRALPARVARDDLDGRSGQRCAAVLRGHEPGCAEREQRDLVLSTNVSGSRREGQKGAAQRGRARASRTRAASTRGRGSRRRAGACPRARAASQTCPPTTPRTGAARRAAARARRRSCGARACAGASSPRGGRLRVRRAARGGRARTRLHPRA
jgi:hypothetical protein